MNFRKHAVQQESLLDTYKKISNNNYNFVLDHSDIMSGCVQNILF